MKNLLAIAFINMLFLISCNCEDESNTYLDCIESFENAKHSDDLDYVDYNDAYHQWLCADINHFSYTYSIRREGDCSGSAVTVEIINSEIIDSSIVLGLYDDPIGCTIEKYDPILSIDEIFNLIEEALDPNIQIIRSYYPWLERDPLFRAQDVIISYDSKYRFPSYVYLDYFIGVADEEFALEILEFEILP